MQCFLHPFTPSTHPKKWQEKHKDLPVEIGRSVPRDRKPLLTLHLCFRCHIFRATYVLAATSSGNLCSLRHFFTQTYVLTVTSLCPHRHRPIPLRKGMVQGWQQAMFLPPHLPGSYVFPATSSSFLFLLHPSLGSYVPTATSFGKAMFYSPLLWGVYVSTVTSSTWLCANRHVPFTLCRGSHLFWWAPLGGFLLSNLPSLHGKKKWRQKHSPLGLYIPAATSFVPKKPYFRGFVPLPSFLPPGIRSQVLLPLGIPRIRRSGRQCHRP